MQPQLTDDTPGWPVLYVESPAGQFQGFYNPPFECRDRKVTKGQILDEILHGVGSTEGSSGHVTVSLSVE